MCTATHITIKKFTNYLKKKKCNMHNFIKTFSLVDKFFQVCLEKKIWIWEMTACAVKIVKNDYKNNLKNTS